MGTRKLERQAVAVTTPETMISFSMAIEAFIEVATVVAGTLVNGTRFPSQNAVHESEINPWPHLQVSSLPTI